MYISISMAGANNTGQRAERMVVSNRLSATPLAILAIVLADKGAISSKSAHKPKSTWLNQLPSSFWKKASNSSPKAPGWERAATADCGVWEEGAVELGKSVGVGADDGLDFGDGRSGDGGHFGRRRLCFFSSEHGCVPPYLIWVLLRRFCCSSARLARAGG